MKNNFKFFNKEQQQPVQDKSFLSEPIHISINYTGRSKNSYEYQDVNENLTGEQITYIVKLLQRNHLLSYYYQVKGCMIVSTVEGPNDDNVIDIFTFDDENHLLEDTKTITLTDFLQLV